MLFPYLINIRIKIIKIIFNYHQILPCFANNQQLFQNALSKDRLYSILEN